MDIGRTLRDGFLTGIVLLAPLAITIAVLSFLYGRLTGFTESLLGLVGVASTPIINALALIVLVLAIVGIGIVVRRGLVGVYLISGFDRVMETIPVVQAIYTAARQASNALIGHENQFERVALVEWPREGVHTIGFVTDDTPAELATALDDRPHYNVFIPMSPNPMGGFLAIVPEERLTMTDVSVGRALQMVITTGMSSENELSIDDLRTI
ncbi:DUF502 domain-containing protein [Halococcoides cellulosivorans]|uniref:DUF502 domain-containing protein n=1 Tax=Halococcoides cellulosivorans TaxID=1679096 RepID=A0A2R4X0Q8_9EURY|nr:DUF502 domain-containing protein [Halococcoides cellulosivorans]AWB27388.1 hypothetical protein HARCEL1_06570 [Halococcoides cellulosivorans]